MYTKQSKKLLIINILDIFRKYTDVDHRLSQKEIIDILRREYGMKADRKAVRRNILDLIDFGYEIEYTETIRVTPNPKTGEPEENRMLSDFYLVRDFTDGELRLLIDSLLFSKHVPYSQCRALVGKLEGLSPMHSLVSIALPICRPVIMTVAVFQIFSYWNSWYPALVYIDTNHSELYPLQYVLVNIERTVQSLTRDAAVISGMQNVNVPGMTIRMALVVVTVLPVIILFPFFQRFLNTGMTIGAVKE